MQSIVYFIYFRASYENKWSWQFCFDQLATKLKMACATLKRSLDWEPVLGGRPAKRRRCVPFCSSPTQSGLGSPGPSTSPTGSSSPKSSVFPDVKKFTPGKNKFILLCNGFFFHIYCILGVVNDIFKSFFFNLFIWHLYVISWLTTLLFTVCFMRGPLLFKLLWTVYAHNKNLLFVNFNGLTST